MKLKQRKSRNKPIAAAPETAPAAKATKASKPAKASGVSVFLAEQAAKTRGVVDWHARKPGSRAL